MAVRGVLGAEWDSEKVGECGVGAEGPDRAGLWDQLEEERERENGCWEGQGKPPPLAASRAHGSYAARADSGRHSGCSSFTLY